MPMWSGLGADLHYRSGSVERASAGPPITAEVVAVQTFSALCQVLTSGPWLDNMISSLRDFQRVGSFSVVGIRQAGG